VIDGKYYGRPIVSAPGPVPRYAPQYAPTYAAATYAPQTYGGQSALALDAADGVIDGKYYGRPIVGGSGALVPHRGFAPSYGGTAFALDDPYYDGGRYGYGRPWGGYGYGGYAPAYGPSYGGGVPASAYGRYRSPYYGAYGNGYGYVPQYSRAQSQAAALDAADGVIDGKYYGRQIVAN